MPGLQAAAWLALPLMERGRLACSGGAGRWPGVASERSRAVWQVVLPGSTGPCVGAALRGVTRAAACMVDFSFSTMSCHALEERASHASCAEASRAVVVWAVGNTERDEKSAANWGHADEAVGSRRAGGRQTHAASASGRRALAGGSQ